MPQKTYQKIFEVKKSIPYIQKQSKQYMKFTVVTSEDVLTAIQPAMIEHGLILEPHIIKQEITREEIGINPKNNKKIFSYLVNIELEYRWVNVENPQDSVSCRFAAIAEDENASYALGQALTYAEKTFILKYFNIPTDDSDPDIFQQQLLKKIPIEDVQIESLEMLVDKLVPYSNGNSKEAIRKQANLSAKITDIDKPFNQYSAYEFGVVANVMNGWLNTYEKNAKRQQKEN